MKTPIDIWIGQAEENWLGALYTYARELYQKTFLPSHDHSHHLRVWNIAKQLLKEISASHSSLTQARVEGVLIAALFHDLGMAKSTREDHGRLGRELCFSWFSTYGHPHPPGFDQILEAIEMHDRKEVRIYPEAESSSTILNILSVADDLEAMGVIGIYRYAEIYLLRGIPMEDLGVRILENAEHRILNLTSSGFCTGVIDRYQNQFDELSSFYKQYIRQLQEVEQAEKHTEGQLGVINYIRSQGISQQVRPEDLSRKAEEEGKEPMIRDFFSKLKNELEKERE